MMRAWWQERSFREQVLLAVGLCGVAGFVLVQLIFLPTFKFRAEAARANLVASRNLAEVQASAAKWQSVAQRMPSDGAGATNSETLHRSVSLAAQGAGILISRMQPRQDNELEIWVETATSTSVYAWLASMQQDYGIGIKRVTLQAQSDGATISAQIVLARGNR